MASKVRCMNSGGFGAQWEALVLARPGLAYYVQTHKGVSGLDIDSMSGWKMTNFCYSKLSWLSRYVNDPLLYHTALLVRGRRKELL